MKQKYNCVVLDDEPLASSLISSYINKCPDLVLAGSYSNAYQAMRRMAEHDVDILFCDIQMPGVSGIEFTRMIDESISVIFTTAFQQYAYDGFKAGAIDYLLKPIQFSDFRKAVDKAIRYIKGSMAIAEAHYVSIRTNYQLVRIDTNDILYIEADKDYMKIVTTGKEYQTLVTLKQLLLDLPPQDFIRVHRSFVVKRSIIKVLNHDGILINGKLIPISATHKQEVLDIIMG